VSIVISGAFVLATFLIVAMITFGTFIGTTATQSASLKEASDLRIVQVAGDISIISVSTADSAGSTDLTVAVKNTGAISYGNFLEMDVLTKYTNSTGDQELKRLDYECKQLCGDPGDPGDNKWTIVSLSPDSYNPKMWDPDETATISARLVPQVKNGTSGTVVAVVPGGVSEPAYFNK